MLTKVQSATGGAGRRCPPPSRRHVASRVGRPQDGASPGRAKSRRSLCGSRDVVEACAIWRGSLGFPAAPRGVESVAPLADRPCSRPLAWSCSRGTRFGSSQARAWTEPLSCARARARHVTCALIARRRCGRSLAVCRPRQLDGQQRAYAERLVAALASEGWWRTPDLVRRRRLHRTMAWGAAPARPTVCRGGPLTCCLGRDRLQLRCRWSLPHQEDFVLVVPSCQR